MTKPSCSSGQMYHILNGLCKNISDHNETNIHSIHLINVFPGTEGWGCLAKGLKVSLTL